MRGLSSTTRDLIVYARKVLQEIRPATLRQLHYAIFSRGEIAYDNDKGSYQRLSRATSMARRTYRAWELGGKIGPEPADGIRPSYMIDEQREAKMVSVWEDASSFIDTIRSAYRRDLWQDQNAYCEVWSEKATVLGSLRPIQEDLGITLRNCKGFGSAGMELDIGRQFELLQGRDIHVFFIGDFDPSGVVIPEDIHRRAQAAAGFHFRTERLAIFESDIKAFRLPPQKIKTTDSRAAGFQRRFGKNAATVELDALPVDELRNRIDTAVRRLIDPKRWARQLVVENVEAASIRGFVNTIKNLPQVSS